MLAHYLVASSSPLEVAEFTARSARVNCTVSSRMEHNLHAALFIFQCVASDQTCCVLHACKILPLVLAPREQHCGVCAHCLALEKDLRNPRCKRTREGPASDPRGSCVGPAGNPRGTRNRTRVAPRLRMACGVDPTKNFPPDETLLSRFFWDVRGPAWTRAHNSATSL